jgi:hypothetical protein
VPRRDDKRKRTEGGETRRLHQKWSINGKKIPKEDEKIIKQNKELDPANRPVGSPPNKKGGGTEKIVFGKPSLYQKRI